MRKTSLFQADEFVKMVSVIIASVLPTLPFSTHWVTITTLWTFCSQTIFQKSSLVPGRGPCVAMYSRRKLLPWKQRAWTPRNSDNPCDWLIGVYEKMMLLLTRSLTSVNTLSSLSQVSETSVIISSSPILLLTSKWVFIEISLCNGLLHIQPKLNPVLTKPGVFVLQSLYGHQKTQTGKLRNEVTMKEKLLGGPTHLSKN